MLILFGTLSKNEDNLLNATYISTFQHKECHKKKNATCNHDEALATNAIKLQLHILFLDVATLRHSFILIYLYFANTFFPAPQIFFLKFELKLDH